jgi:hypothetical protein
LVKLLGAYSISIPKGREPTGVKGNHPEASYEGRY